MFGSSGFEGKPNPHTQKVERYGEQHADYGDSQSDLNFIELFTSLVLLVEDHDQNKCFMLVCALVFTCWQDRSYSIH